MPAIAPIAELKISSSHIAVALTPSSPLVARQPDYRRYPRRPWPENGGHFAAFNPRLTRRHGFQRPGWGRGGSAGGLGGLGYGGGFGFVVNLPALFTRLPRRPHSSARGEILAAAGRAGRRQDGRHSPTGGR
jgi:hypothetical protein